MNTLKTKISKNNLEKKSINFNKIKKIYQTQKL